VTSGACGVGWRAAGDGCGPRVLIDREAAGSACYLGPVEEALRLAKIYILEAI
jgi:hypothetical protein